MKKEYLVGAAVTFAGVALFYVARKTFPAVRRITG